MHIQAVVVGVNKQRFSVDLSLKPSHLRYAHTQTCIHVHIHTHTLIHTCIHTHSTHTVGWSSLSPLLFPYPPPLSNSPILFPYPTPLSYPTSFLTSTNSMTVRASGTSLSSSPSASLVLPDMIENMEERRAGWCEI